MRKRIRDTNLRLFLVHHGDAVGPDVDTRRPLSSHGQLHVDWLAEQAARRGVRPQIFWHSGKLRARQTAEAFWRACNALGDCSSTRDLQPDDSPKWIRDRLQGETRDVLIAGHFPHLPRLLMLLAGAPDEAAFPKHGLVVLASEDEGAIWKEEWRLT